MCRLTRDKFHWLWAWWWPATIASWGVQSQLPRLPNQAQHVGGGMWIAVSRRTLCQLKSKSSRPSCDCSRGQRCNMFVFKGQTKNDIASLDVCFPAKPKVSTPIKTSITIDDHPMHHNWNSAEWSPPSRISPIDKSKHMILMPDAWCLISDAWYGLPCHRFATISNAETKHLTPKTVEDTTRSSKYHMRVIQIPLLSFSLPFKLLHIFSSKPNLTSHFHSLQAALSKYHTN